MINKFHAFCIAGTNSGVGKTTITLGLLRALKRRGLKVAPFKCGPDYIDTAFHKAACGSPSRNLDTWMANDVRFTFQKGTIGADCAVIEGVMGMFDGAKPGKLEGSTADVALKLNVPVLLAVNARGMAGSIAPIVKGYTEFRKEIKVIGVIANNVSSERHASILEKSLIASKLPPLLGWIPRDESLKLPERHLGLVPVFENRKKQKWFDKLAAICEKNVNIEKILKLSVARKQKTEDGGQRTGRNSIFSQNHPISIGVAYDDAFNFYYEDNFDFLKDAGHKLVFFSPLKDKSIPKGVSALYIGGGFPEIFAKKLSANKSMLKSIADFAKSGGRILAECGGFMYLSKSLTDINGKKFKMCEVLPCSTVMENKLHGLGYREVKLLNDSFLGIKGTKFRGHEFHWSSSKGQVNSKVSAAFDIRDSKGHKIGTGGIQQDNVLASYIHIYFK